MRHRRRAPLPIAPAACAAALTAWAGCSSPLAVQSEQDLRRAIVEATRREVAQAELFPAPRPTLSDFDIARLGIREEFLPELVRMAGPASYDRDSLTLQQDLLGQPQATVKVSLQQALRSAAENNLEVQFARLAPAISQAQVVAAQAAFDWTLFDNATWSNTDDPQTATFGGASADQRVAMQNQLGLRRQLVTGGQLTLQTDLAYNHEQTEGLSTNPNPSDLASVVLRLDQPLLRNFGSDVALAQVRLNRNAERSSIAQLKIDLSRIVTDTELAYWDLVQAQYNLLILQRLLERGNTVLARTERRVNVDATPAQIADARATVERRRADVERARNVVRQASDRLKSLINDPALPVGGASLILPADDALDQPVSFSLLELLGSAIRNRPEIQQAILSLDDTAIRQVVADNARLPQLDARLEARFQGLDDTVGPAYAEAASGQFISYLVGVAFQVPIGNRRAEAEYRIRRLERSQATIAYSNTVQQVTLEVVRALRDVYLQYQLIGQTRIARFAESENLRTLLLEQQQSTGYTVQALDLERRRQETLALAEQEETRALIDYMTSLARLHAATGTALERSRIDFVVPDPP